jgi:hypothetical protein
MASFARFSLLSVSSVYRGLGWFFDPVVQGLPAKYFMKNPPAARKLRIEGEQKAGFSTLPPENDRRQNAIVCPTKTKKQRISNTGWRLVTQEQYHCLRVSPL